MVESSAEKNGWDISCRGTGRSLEITARGRAAHAAKPYQGLNAISILMDFLSGLNFLNDGTMDFVNFYNERIGFNVHGERIGCALEDEDSGKLMFNAGMIELDRNAAKLTVNLRYPVSCTGAQVYAGIMEVLDGYGYGIVKNREQLPINIDADSELVSTLMRAYRANTGDTESEPLVIGGGTYARAFENVVAFGARFPGQPELCHKRNEKIATFSDTSALSGASSPHPVSEKAKATMTLRRIAVILRRKASPYPFVPTDLPLIMG